MTQEERNRNRMINALIGDCSKIFLNMNENKSSPRDYRDIYFYWRGMFRFAEVQYEFTKEQKKEFIDILDKLAFKKRKMFGFFGKEIDVYKGDK